MTTFSQRGFNADLKEKTEKFVDGILEWYEKNGRNHLFWRQTENPYHILASEVMLQKTTVKQVRNLIQKFTERFPTPESLAEASIDEIEDMITPLGMEHRRAPRLRKMGELLVRRYEGRVPDCERDLLSLPGVGPYIANSVLYLAFGKEVPILDTNIVRIIERVFDIRSSKARARTDKELWNFVRDMTPEGMSRKVNLSLLDFGALVCTARKPKCHDCALNAICIAYLKGATQPS